MENRPLLALSLLALLNLAAGCASMGGLRAEPLDAGEVHFYGAPLANVVTAARQAALEVGLDIQEVTQVDSLTWMILGKKGVSLVSWGELVRVVVQQSAEGPVAVRVVTKRKLATSATAQAWADPIFEKLDRILLPREDP